MTCTEALEHQCHSNTIKPILTDAIKSSRVRRAVMHIDARRLKFDDMDYAVHIYKECSSMFEKKNIIYLAKGEEPPQRCAKSGSFLAKVIFLSADARPRFDEDATCIFDGKIGKCPFVESVITERASHNHLAGTPELESINVTRDVFIKNLIEYVIPAFCLSGQAVVQLLLCSNRTMRRHTATLITPAL